MAEIWFFGTPMDSYSTTISQFLDAIDGTGEWSDEEKKTFALNHLKGPAELFSQENLQADMNWNDIKVKLFERFQCHLSVWDKIEMKRNLAQDENENIRDFYNRCVSYQYLVCDDFSETVLDNEILTTFMLGMHKSILNTMHQRFSTSELDLNLCLTEAEIIECEIPKQQKNPAANNGAAHSDSNFVEISETTSAFNYNHSDGTFKKEPKDVGFSSNSPGPSKAKNGSSPVKKVKKEFSSSNPSPSKKLKTNFGTPPKVPKTNFGTPPKVPNADFAAPSNIDGYLTQNPDGGVSCNVCGKVVSCMSSARRHYKTTHEEIEPTPCPLGCGLEFKNPTSLENHLKNVHSVTKQQIKHAQRIPMSNQDFLLVLASDNVMCFTASGCNTKLSCVSSARRHYKQRHEKKQSPGSGTPNKQQNISGFSNPSSTAASYVDPNFQAENNYVNSTQNNFNGSSGYGYNTENPTNMVGFSLNTGTFKREPSQDIGGMNNFGASSNVHGISPTKKVKKEKIFGTPPKNPKPNFGGTPPKKSTSLATPTKAVRNVTPSSDMFLKTPEGKVQCLTCQKWFSRIDVAKMHYIKTHQEDQAIECPLCKNYHAKNTYDWNDHAKNVHQMSASDMKNLQIVYSPMDNTDAILAQRPDGRVACLKCIDEQGCHKTFSRKDVAKLHFKKVHGPC